MKSFLDCWSQVAAALFPQALAGAPEFNECLPVPLSGKAFGYAATLTGNMEGRFSVLLDATVLESPLTGEGADQKAAWSELLREIADAAAGELQARTGQDCKVDSFEEIDEVSKATRAFQLCSGEHSWTILVADEVRALQSEESSQTVASADRPSMPRAGIELLLDVELEAALRFGCREMPLGQMLDLGPGDVVQLDRHVSDPVDLIVGDKIVARGEVVLVNGNFGLRVTEVAAPKRRLESIRCLF
jgi:flagellar motor switch protein FliN